jgi:4'-phosphopantetheinyl transferase
MFEIRPRTQLVGNQIHVWCCRPSLIADSQLLQQYFSLLNEDELKRYHRFHFDKDRHRHLVTRALVRTTLSHYIPNIQPKSWIFDHNDFGKPSIGNTISDSIQFNISHSQDFIVVAVTNEQTIGIDVECIRERKSFNDLIDHCFNKEEQLYLFEDNSREVFERFFQLWTLKEAYIKAFGKGLAISLKDITLKVDENTSITFRGKHKDDPSKWLFHSFKPDPHYQLAIAIEKKSDKPSQVRLFESTPLANWTECNNQSICNNSLNQTNLK